MKEKALARFKKIIKESSDYRELVNLDKDGWIEMRPRGASLRFKHPDFPRVRISWDAKNPPEAE